MLVEGDAVLGKALNEGLHRTVINAEIERDYRLFPGLVHKTLDVEHHIAKGEGWSEQLVAIANRASEHIKSNNKVDWWIIARNHAKARPPCVGDIDAHVKLCQKYGGGASMQFIHGFSGLLRMRMGLHRSV